MPSIFTKLIAGEIPCAKVYEDDQYFAFLDIRPMKAGHTIVIPKKEVNYLFDVDPETMAGLWETARKVAKALEAAVPCKRIGVMVAGLEVPHAHIHLVPMEGLGELNFALQREADGAELQALAARIREKL